MRACSLLAIPPPPDQRALPGGLPDDLSQDNLSTWAGIVQDVAAGLIVPQPETGQKIFPDAVGLLTLLESVSRVAFCRQCYLPGSACRCLDSASTTSTASTTGLSWSEIADPTYGTNPASAGRGAGAALTYGSLAPWAAPFGIRLRQTSQGSPELLLLLANRATLLGEPPFWSPN